jgi:RHS repeat-associated protein
VLADPLHLSRHQTTPSPPPLSSSFRSSKLQTSNPSYHRNQQYSIIGLTNAAGTLVERYSYTAYGTLGIYDASGTVRTTSTYANRYTYTGREYDPDLNLYHFRARWYDPATGGFISRDPLGYVDGMSLYRGYLDLNKQDPTGLSIRVMINEKRPQACDQPSGFYIRMELSNNPCSEGGYLVQMVKVVETFSTTCNVCPQYIDPEDRVTTYVELYFEWWYFGPGRTSWPILDEYNKQHPDKPRNYNDEMTFTPRSGTAGSITQVREARFYCKEKIGNLGTEFNPKHPWIGRDESKPWGDIPGMYNIPGFWFNEPEFQFEYSTSARWCCFHWPSCCEGGQRFVTLKYGVPETQMPEHDMY